MKKPLYELDNTSRKFWLRVKDVFLNKLGLKTVEGDEAFYFRNLDLNSTDLYSHMLTILKLLEQLNL